MADPFKVVRDFEAALCEYSGGPYAVATTSCTMALLLAVAWRLDQRRAAALTRAEEGDYRCPAGAGRRLEIEIPKRTYVSVPMSIVHAGARPSFRDEDWRGMYELKPLGIWDSARWLTAGIWEQTWPSAIWEPAPPPNPRQGQMICLSFHWSKDLAIGQGGAILHDNAEADQWLRRARFDGRAEGVEPKKDCFTIIGWHAYMMPRDAAEGLTRLGLLPQHNEPLANDDYPDLSQMEIFK